MHIGSFTKVSEDLNCSTANKSLDTVHILLSNTPPSYSMYYVIIKMNTIHILNTKNIYNMYNVKFAPVGGYTEASAKLV